MKVIIAGSRGITDAYLVTEAVTESMFDITEVVSGGARGVDRLGEEFAVAHHLHVKRFLPNWKLGRGAGFIRNIEMAEYADALIAIWDGVSRGTAQMIREAKKRGLRVYVFRTYK